VPTGTAPMGNIQSHSRNPDLSNPHTSNTHMPATPKCPPPPPGVLDDPPFEPLLLLFLPSSCPPPPPPPPLPPTPPSAGAPKKAPMIRPSPAHEEAIGAACCDTCHLPALTSSGSRSLARARSFFRRLPSFPLPPFPSPPFSLSHSFPLSPFPSPAPSDDMRRQN
jgi:hypothetical protein